MADYSWFNRRYQRSIDHLRPWSGNPRLNPEEQHVNLRDFVEDIIQEDGDKANFIDLVRSIATNGFIPADPIVVWKDAKYLINDFISSFWRARILTSPEQFVNYELLSNKGMKKIEEYTKQQNGANRIMLVISNHLPKEVNLVRQQEDWLDIS